METNSPTSNRKRKTESSNEEIKAKKKRDGEQSSPSHRFETQVEAEATTSKGGEEGRTRRNERRSSSPLLTEAGVQDAAVQLASRDLEASSTTGSREGESIMEVAQGGSGQGVAVTINVPGSNAGEIAAYKREENIYHQHNETKVLNVTSGTGNFKAMAERTKANMDASCPQGFVETAGYRLARDLLEEQSRCVVTGQAGSGKTTLAYRLMKHFSSQGFHCVELLSPDEYKEVPWRQNQANFKMLIFIDDVVGRSNLEVALKRKWEKKLEKMMPFVSTGHVKLILASREHIFATFREGSEREVLSGTPEVALACDKLVLPFLERKQILINAMKFKQVSLPMNLTENEVVQAAVDSQQIGYPQLCWFFVTHPEAQEDPIHFFSNPIEFLKKEFATLKLDDKKSFFVLLLVLLQEGKLLQKFLKSNKSAKFLSEVADVVGLSRVPKFGEIKSTATEMCRSYLRFDRDTKAYLFAHQSVWDTLFVYLCEENFEKAMKICSCKQAILYVTTEGCKDSGRGFTYKAPRVEWQVLAQKLLRELTSGATQLACTHPCLQDPSFVQVLLHEFLQEEDARALLTPKAEAYTLTDQTHKISVKDYSNCSLKCGEFLTVATSVGCQGQGTMKSLLQYSHPVSILALHKCFTIVQHILNSDSFSKMDTETKSQILTEVLGCTCFVANTSFVGDLLERGAAPSAECVLAACSAEQEDVELVERLLQWRHLLSAEQQCELARIAVLKDRPRTLQLVLSGLSVSGDDRALLDSVLAELVLLTHGANLISMNQHLKLSSFSSLFSLLTEAGARILPNITLCLAAGHWQPSVFQRLLDSLAHVTEKIETSTSSWSDGAPADQKGGASISSTAADLPADPAVNEQGTKQTSDASITGTIENSPADPVVITPGTDRTSGTVKVLPADPAVNESVADLKSSTPSTSTANDLPADSPPKENGTDHTNGSSIQSTAKDLPTDAAVKERFTEQTSAASINSPGETLPADLAMKELRAILATTDDAGNTPLHWAARFGVLPNVQLLLKLSDQEGQSATLVNAQNKKGYSAMHLAAEHGHLDVVVALLANKADPALLNKHQDSALYLATQKGHSTVVEALVQSGANVNSANDKKNTALHVAAKSGQLQLVDTLLKNGANADLVNGHGHTALQIMTSKSRMDVDDSKISKEGGEDEHKGKSTSRETIFRSLIAATSKQTSETDPPLHRAARRGELSVVKLLLDSEADINIKNPKGMTALHEAAGHCQFRVAELLLTRGAKTSLTDAAGNTVLHALARSNLQSKIDSGAVEHFQVAKIVKKWDTFVNAVNDTGDTPVMTALSKGNLFLVTEMLTLSPDLSLKNKKGNSVLHALAGAASLASGSHEDRSLKQTVAVLVEKFKGCLDEVDQAGDTPLLTALTAGNFCVVKELLTRHCNLNVINKKSWSALHALAAGPIVHADRETGNIIRLMVDKCLQFVNSKDEAGESPILIAATKGNIALVKCLLEHGADVSELGKNRNSLLHALASAGDLTGGLGTIASPREFLSSLVDRISEDFIDLPNAAGNTPVMLALRSGNSRLVQELLRRECDLSIVNSDGETVLHLLAQLAYVTAGRMLAEWREVSEVVVATASNFGILPTATDKKGITPRAIASRLDELHGERYSGHYLVSLWGKEALPSESVRYVYVNDHDQDEWYGHDYESADDYDDSSDGDSDSDEWRDDNYGNTDCDFDDYEDQYLDGENSYDMDDEDDDSSDQDNENDVEDGGMNDEYVEEYNEYDVDNPNSSEDDGMNDASSDQDQDDDDSDHPGNSEDDYHDDDRDDDYSDQD